MATRQPIRYALALGGKVYEVLDIRGEESLSRPFRFDLSFHIDQDDLLEPDDLVDTDAALLLVSHEEERRVEGTVTEITRGVTRKALPGRHGGARVQVRLEARLATARHRVDIRVFRERTAPEIVTEVLAAHGVAVERRLSGEYVRRPYCVQMRESDLDFAARLLEDEGIFFACADAGGGVVLGDAMGSYDDPIGQLPFRGAAGIDGGEHGLVEVGWVGEATAGKISLRDFNFERPSADMDVSVPGPTSWGPEWYDYPGEYEAPSEGRQKAQLRASALACRKERLAGRAYAARLHPGARFELVDAPHGVRDGEYVVTRLRHAWNRTREGFSVELEALPARTVFRPPVTTPVPTLVNPLTGYVTGPAGADIHTEAWGRVKVHFPWDRVRPKDDDASHWVPVLQDNTGHSASIPRVGWEVLCHFLEGDPDRPVVMGRVFNGEDTFTEMLPAKKSRTSLQSLSSPRSADGPSGFNMIRFEDAAGQEAVDIHAQKDQNVVVANDQLEQIDAGEAIVVNGNETVVVGNDQKVVVTKQMASVVDGNQAISIGGDRTAKIGAGLSDAITGNHVLTIGGAHTRRVAGKDQLDVGGNLTESIAGLDLEASVKTNSKTAGRVSVLAVGGAIVEIARKGKSEGAGKARAETIGGLYFTKSSKETATRAEKLRKTTVGGFYKVNAAGEILLAGIDAFTSKATTTSMVAPSITLKVGETVIHLKGGTIDMISKEIALETDAQNKQGAATSTQA